MNFWPTQYLTDIRKVAQACKQDIASIVPLGKKPELVNKMHAIGTGNLVSK
jgi:hypothetical protein